MKSERTPQRLHPQEFFLDNDGFPFFRLPEEALAELKPSAMNRSTNSHILIYNRVNRIEHSFYEKDLALGTKMWFHNNRRGIEESECPEQLFGHHLT